MEDRSTGGDVFGGRSAGGGGAEDLRLALHAQVLWCLSAAERQETEETDRPAVTARWNRGAIGEAEERYTEV